VIWWSRWSQKQILSSTIELRSKSRTNTNRYAKKTTLTPGHLSGNLCWIL